MKTFLITGCNRGIGLEYCRQFKKRGDEVIATCRSSSPELEEIGVRIESDVDVSSGESVLKLKDRLEGVYRELKRIPKSKISLNSKTISIEGFNLQLN